MKLDGFDALVRELTEAPAEIRTEAMGILREETEGAAVEIGQRYPAHSGTLRRRVKTTYPSSTILLGIVQSTAPHSHLFEFGTKARHNEKGANRGRMPKADPAVVVPIAQRRRARMLRRFREMLVRRGYQVSE